MFHISKENLGRNPVFTPRTYKQDSVDTPRICVAPTIAGCFSAIDWYDVWDDSLSIIYVYETLPGTDIEPCSNQIKDRDITEEHWILEKTQMRLRHAIYPNSPLYRNLLKASIECWAHCMDRSPCLDLDAQKKEMDMMLDIFEDVKWGLDNMPCKDLESTPIFDISLSV